MYDEEQLLLSWVLVLLFSLERMVLWLMFVFPVSGRYWHLRDRLPYGISKHYYGGIT
jgi:hypothetical protein